MVYDGAPLDLSSPRGVAALNVRMNMAGTRSMEALLDMKLGAEAVQREGPGALGVTRGALKAKKDAE